MVSLVCCPLLRIWIWSYHFGVERCCRRLLPPECMNERESVTKHYTYCDCMFCHFSNNGITKSTGTRRKGVAVDL